MYKFILYKYKVTLYILHYYVAFTRVISCKYKIILYTYNIYLYINLNIILFI